MSLIQKVLKEFSLVETMVGTKQNPYWRGQLSSYEARTLIWGVAEGLTCNHLLADLVCVCCGTRAPLF